MLGRRHPQRSLFEAPAWPHPIPSDSFYARLAAVNAILFRDEDLAELYCPDNGRPSLPPSLLSGVTLLQFYDNVSDEEAVERTRYDLRWKVALHLPLDFAEFDPSCLSYFRKRLVEHQQERYAFDRLITVARTAGFLPDKVTLLTDTTWVKGCPGRKLHPSKDPSATLLDERFWQRLLRWMRFSARTRSGNERDRCRHHPA